MPQVCWENGCPMTTTDPTYEAAMLGRLGMLKYLHEHGFPWSVGMCIAVTVQIYVGGETAAVAQSNLLHGGFRKWAHGLLAVRTRPSMWDSEHFGGYADVKILQRETITRRKGHVRRLKGPITSALLEPLG